jgi:hypothetical protein
VVLMEEISRLRPDFYSLMGWFFGSRQVAKEVGINIYDDQDKRWFVAFEGGRIIGFASLKGRLVSDCYVVPSKRNAGVFRGILTMIEIASSGPLAANCTKASRKAFANAGFVEVRKTKNFTYMELDRA